MTGLSILVFAIIALALSGCGGSPSVGGSNPFALARPTLASPTPDITALRTWSDADSKATADFARGLRERHPEAAWPHWFADNTLAWTSLGLDGGGVEGLIATDGTISPVANQVGIDFWLRDDSSGILYAPRPGQVTQRLARGQLPVETSTWKIAGASLGLTIVVRSSAPNPIEPGPDGESDMIVDAEVTGAGAAHPWTLYVVARPYGPAGGISPIQRVDVSPAALSLDRKLAIVPLEAPTVVGALDEHAVDASLLLARESSDFASSATSKLGLAEGFFGYRLDLSEGKTSRLDFVMPMRSGPASQERVDRLRAIDPVQSERAVEDAWWNRLHRVRVSLPDQASVNAFYASLAYLLMARRTNLVSPGAMNLDRMWVRDAAYIADALDKTGNGDLVEPVLQTILEAQLPSGRFPPVILADGTAQLPLNTEWDTQGEAITAAVQYARDTGNSAFLRAAYPRLVNAAQFQRLQIQGASADLSASSPFSGLLPAGDSAEDLYGGGRWHHLWDDLWAIAGFQETAALARQYGDTSDAVWLSDSASRLQAAVLRVGEQTRLSDGRSVLPNGPEDHTYTAMARSVTPAIWPVETLDPSNPLVQQSFAYYYQNDVAPYQGAYLHYGDNFWPYAGISLAHAFYRLGWVDDAWTMYRWAMDHQTAPNLYSWPEAVHRDRPGQANGDMPNSWMSAELILLTRDVLLHEDGDHLDIGPLFPSWLPAGATISVGDLPSAFGPQTYTLQRSADGARLTLSLAGSPPPGGYRISAPATIRAIQLDGAAPVAVDGPTATIRAGTRQAVLTLATG